jgi:hypothetical protein
MQEWVELYLHSPNTRGAQGKHRDNFTFTFTLPYPRSSYEMVIPADKYN